ncbi:MAG: tRNA (adenosine(37)-N6)-threonylcarbamoyltransferase complex ATPase subunit type 1 TsaE, partial [Tenericutes bacterium HGW-Tenericutes-8]
AKETTTLGFQVGLLLKPGMVLLLEGDLAAGKTTFTKGIGQALGIERTINSPTFTIMKRYMKDENKLYHVDLYRLDDINTDFDLEDYINSDGVSVIEWPFKVKDILPKAYLLVSFTVMDNDQRKITFEAKGDFYESVVRYL